jgi:hypothetical protein
MSLVSVKRNQELNQGTFVFKVYPPLFNIKRMNLTHHALLECPAIYSASDIKYDTSKGELTLTADYESDMEGIPCIMTLTFDSNIIRSADIAVSFDAVSSTLPLVIIANQEQLKTLNTIFFAISYVVLAVFFLSLGHKMIGVEVMTNLQLIYLSNAFYKKTYFFLNELRGIHMVTGYWALFHDENDQIFIPPFSERVDVTPYFLENSLIVLTVLMPATVVLLVLKIIIHQKTIETVDVETQEQSEGRLLPS